MQRETLKEYTRRFCDGCSNTQWDNSPATECGQCLEDFVEGIIRLCTPKPSDDMTVPMENPYKEYLLWTKSDGWFVGCYDKKKGVFYWTTHDLYGDETISPTYWLPVPPHPYNA